MRTWHLDPHASRGTSDLARATVLVAALDAREERAFAQAVLGLFDDLPAVAHCSVLAYEAGRPRTLSIADYRSDDGFLREIADTYTQRFYALDGKQHILAATAPGASVVLHQQSSADITHEDYRNACYRRPNLSERIALLTLRPDQVWLSVNLYRDNQGSVFSPGEIARIETLAPFVLHAAAQHYTLHGLRAQDAPIADRLTRLCPDLSRRERDVLCGVLDGRTTAEIAGQIGVKPSSVMTYQKRAYQRLGISGQRQLFAALLQSRA